MTLCKNQRTPKSPGGLASSSSLLQQEIIKTSSLDKSQGLDYGGKVQNSYSIAKEKDDDDAESSRVSAAAKKGCLEHG